MLRLAEAALDNCLTVMYLTSSISLALTVIFQTRKQRRMYRSGAAAQRLLTITPLVQSGNWYITPVLQHSDI